MQKFYYRMLISFVLFAGVINAVSFLTDLNPRQLTNISFFKERAEAEAYLLKNIVVETGINLKTFPKEELLRIASSAAEKYGVDEDLLLLLIVPGREYEIGMTGGMGLTKIKPSDFFSTSYKDPFDPQDNIFATAETLKRYEEEGVSREALPEKFLLGKREETVKLLAPQVYALSQKVRATYADILRAKGGFPYEE